MIDIDKSTPSQLLTVKSQRLTVKKTSVFVTLPILLASTLIGCDKPADTSAPIDTTTESVIVIDKQAKSQSNLETQSTLSNGNAETSTAITSNTAPPDWSQINTGVPKADVSTYHYPIAIDSEPVKSYANMFNITLKQAQHSLVLGTASNEALIPILEQLGDRYISHQLTDGETVKLIVQTTQDVPAATFDYVIKNEFAHGLVLPVEITPTTQP